MRTTLCVVEIGSRENQTKSDPSSCPTIASIPLVETVYFSPPFNWQYNNGLVFRDDHSY